MSHFDYKVSIHIAACDFPFYSLVMAAMRKADTNNMEKLVAAFPGVYEELMLRYNAPGGLLPEERHDTDSTREPEKADVDLERPASLGG